MQVAARLTWSNQRFEQVTSWWLLGFCVSFLFQYIANLTTLPGMRCRVKIFDFAVAVAKRLENPLDFQPSPTGQGLCFGFGMPFISMP